MIQPGQVANGDERSLPSSLEALHSIAQAGARSDPAHDLWNHSVRKETPLQRVDRNYHELLQELRVAQIGVQVLFAALLNCAFTNRFAALTSYQRGLFVVALLLTVVTASLLTAPAAYHRLLFRLRIKSHIVDAANRFVIAGLVMLVFAMSSVLLLILDMVIGHFLAVLVSVTGVAWFGCWWYAAPMIKRIRHRVVRPVQDDIKEWETS